ncbi:calmodulin-binding transcription activator 2 isoform X3 [Cimex lectularius]|uniref:CG-1 domain-containing protein n=1 Tax=Cimex lectularius TaxID=79782 RepID=A0A8I6SF32_CIMLE|nr:calmodulin-binding transcription activator 2 isoform X3 [Cimex lectularius]
MATSALVCINLKTRVKSEGEDGGGEGREKELGAPNTQQLVQALVDNGVIQLNHKATIRVIDNSKPDSQDLADFKTLNLGTFAVKQSPDTRSGILLETVGDGESGEQKVVSLVQNRPILVQRNLVLQGPVLSKGPGLVHLVQESPPPLTPTPPNSGAINVSKSKKILDSDSNNGEPIKLPENLESLPKAEHFPTQRHRWNTNEEIAAILICFERHLDWQSKEVKIRPKSGSMLLYSRKKVRYRRDGYCWKKRKDGKTTREDHMKLKVQGTECIYGCYVHSAILPTFHRRCYWLLQNPDIVLVHYLNVPYPDDNKIVSPSLALCADKKQWTKEELVSQLKPMFYSEEEPDANNELEISTAETVETIVSQLLARQRSARTAAICKQLECGCPDSTCADAKTCSQPIRRITSAKPEPSSDSNQVSSTTGSGMLVSGRGMVHGERAVPVHHIHPNHQIPHGSNSQNGAGTPLVLSLSQLQAPGSLLILNSNQSTSNHVASLVTQRHTRKEKHQDPPMEVIYTLENNHCQISQPVAAQMRGPNIQQQQTSNTNVGDIDKHNRLKYRRKQANKTQVKPYLTPQMKDMGGSEYYETLDLSQEDIQQTLSANMPLSCTQNDNRDSREEGNKQNAVLPGLEIDFIDVNTSSQVDDDVFVNLDAFDMLSEFPDLEGLDHNHNGNNLGEPVVSGSGENGEVMDTEKGNNSPPRMDYREGTANITDYSPEWAYTEGGVKVLVTGPWYSTTSPYTVLFDSCPVPTTLVQSGVLRCFCPAHEAGMVTLQVACEGFVISNSAMFEYKRLPPSGSERATEVSTRESQPHDSLLRFTLMQRLDAIDNRLDIKQEPQDNTENTTLLGKGNFEEKLMNFVQKLSQRKWKESELVDSSIEWCESYKGMTLLHLSASLGYSRLVCMLIKWRTENPAPLLELEVDGLNQDSDGFTPLMRACEKGQSEMSQLLYEWLPASASLVNTKGDSALEVASKNGHTTLAQELQIRLDKSSRFPIAKQLEDNDKDIDSLDGVHTSLESLNSSRDDGIFLHPSSLNRSDYGMNMELHVNIPQWNETRADLSRNSTPSPSSQTKSLLSERLVKRPSVDSGIQLQSSIDSLPSIRASKQSKQNDIQKMSRFDRSMSLPLTCHSMDSGYDLNETLHSSPIRRMDFTLCEVRREGAQSSPESVLLNQEDPHLQQTVGEQDVRVLTLAEQIIAAMPERIKNESEGDMMMMSSDEMEVMSLESPLLLDEPPSSTSSCCFDTSSEFNFDHNYRYCDVGTPCSSLSPASCLPSPPFPLHRSPSPPPTTADFCEFLQASNSTYFEKDFSNLTLSDREQRELYEAAKVIQKAYRSYKGRKKLEQDKERQAAVLIQNYYRRYKQYAYFKQMTRAAMVIQNGYRSYCENKRFKKNQEAAVRIQNCYRNYRDQTETAPTGLKRTYSQRRQHQAARKIQQFMRQSKNNLWEIDPGTIVAERASRKREAGPMQGVPSKLAVLPFHITKKKFHLFRSYPACNLSANMYLGEYLLVSYYL